MATFSLRHTNRITVR